MRFPAAVTLGSARMVARHAIKVSRMSCLHAETIVVDGQEGLAENRQVLHRFAELPTLATE